MINRQNIYFLLILISVALISFWKIGQHDLQEWDESRNGVNAFEMFHNHDYVNYYYDKELDTWNAKPPLMIWLIAISYKIFGFNEFALRFPSVISSLIFLIFCFKLIKLLEDGFKALLCCLILISSKAILGNHLGLTGDFDALLIMWLSGSVYYFILYVEKQKKYAIYFMAIFTGLAFYTKGTASLIFIPGFLLYILIRKKGFEFLKDLRVWTSALIFLGIAGSWFAVVYFFGKTASHSVYGTHNSIETMLIHDTFKRLTSADFGQIHERDYLFFFEVIDAKLNLWNYIFYLSLITGLYHLYANRKNLPTFIKEDSNRLTLLSVCLILPLSIVLSFASSKHNWYLAPIFMFIAFIIAKGIYYIGNKWKPLYIFVIILFTFTFVRNIINVYDQEEDLHVALYSNENLRNKKLIVIKEVKQNILLYLNWLNMDILKVNEMNELDKYKGQIVLLTKDQVNNALANSIEPIQYFEEYCLAKIK